MTGQDKRTDRDRLILPTECDRRTFLSRCAGALAGVTVVGIAAPLLQSCTIASSAPEAPKVNSLTIDVAALVTGPLAGDNTALITSSKGPDAAPILVIRRTADTFVALTSTCTHQSCQVTAPESADLRFHARPDASTDKIDTIWCQCHDSMFDLTGKVISGPAPKPLPTYKTTYNPATKSVTITF